MPGRSEKELDELREQLRAEPPSGLGRLAAEDLQHLAEAIRTARSRQAAALERAGDQAFNSVPRLLRGPIRRVMR
jgi:hypothetical protein